MAAAGDNARFWECRWRLEKRHADISEWDDREEFHEFIKPYEVIEGEGNILVNAGIQLLLDLLIGAGGTVFSNANSYIGVGDGTTAASAAQTDLVGSNKDRQPMESTFPSRSAQTLSFKAVWASGEGNFAWEEWAVFNASSSGTMLNRKVQDFGTKSSGTWTLTVQITIS